MATLSHSKMQWWREATRGHGSEEKTRFCFREPKSTVTFVTNSTRQMHQALIKAT